MKNTFDVFIVYDSVDSCSAFGEDDKFYFKLFKLIGKEANENILKNKQIENNWTFKTIEQALMASKKLKKFKRIKYITIYQMEEGQKEPVGEIKIR